MSAASHPQSRPQPKGILKKPTTTFSHPHQHDHDHDHNQDHPQEKPARDNDPSTTARNRALLQSLLATNPSLLNPPIPLETFELLSTLPQAPCPPHSASNPSPADVRLFLSHLRDFRPGEYLDLIEERNCLGRCGYALCPRDRRKYGGQFKLVGSAAAGSGSGSGPGPGFARTEDLNKWCSDACARRALYLKVQLDNPSYERAAAAGVGGAGEWVVKLELREEEGEKKNKQTTQEDQNKEEANGESGAAAPARGSDDDREQLARAMAQLELDKTKTKQAKRDASALAAERGDASGGLFVGHSKVEVTITEKSEVEPAEPPRQSENVDAHLLVEGYKTALGSDKKPEDEGADSDDDEFPTIRF